IKQQKDIPGSESESSPATPVVGGHVDAVKPYSRALCDALIGFVGRVLQSSDKKQMERLISVAVKMTTAIFEAGGMCLLNDAVAVRKLNEPVIKEIIRQFCQIPGPTGDVFTSLALLIFSRYRHQLHGQYIFFINHLLSLGRGKAIVGP